MNFSEFKKLIGADPLNRDPETVQARNSSPEFEAAAQEAEAFEEKLQGALNIPAPNDLLDDIKAISRQPNKQRSWIPLAIAASLLIAVGSAGIVWKQAHTWESVEHYVQDHYQHDGSSALADATDLVPSQDIARIMTRLGVSADDSLSERIRLIKYCPTPDGRGAHMIVSTDQGLMTVIYMPETEVKDGEIITFEKNHAMLVTLDKGSAAIIGGLDQPVESIEGMVRSALRSRAIGA